MVNLPTAQPAILIPCDDDKEEKPKGADCCFKKKKLNSLLNQKK